jgi:hypothetical protein
VKRIAYVPTEKQMLRSNGEVTLMRVTLTGRGSRKPIEISYAVEVHETGAVREFGNVLDADYFYRTQDHFFRSRMTRGPYGARI